MGRVDTAVNAIETRWRVTLPGSFCRLYRAFEYPIVSVCEFLPLDVICDGGERWRGMLPQFLPFGRDEEEGFYGFYLSPEAPNSAATVLAWNHEYDHYYPVASSFDAFLRWTLTVGRFMGQDAFDEADAEDESDLRRELVDKMGLPSSLNTAPIPRNESELSSRLVSLDPQSAHALTQCASHLLGQGDVDKARDLLARASEAAPWFADPYHLLATTYEGAEAADRWWKAIQCPIALSTRTGNYDLGAEEGDAEIQEAAALSLLAARADLPPDRRDGALMRLLAEKDAFESGSRLALARELGAGGDTAGAERETLNALTLATEESELEQAYAGLVSLYEAAGRERDAETCRHDARLK